MNNDDAGINVIRRLISWGRDSSIRPAVAVIAEDTITLRCPGNIGEPGGVGGSAPQTPLPTCASTNTGVENLLYFNTVEMVITIAGEAYIPAGCSEVQTIDKTYTRTLTRVDRNLSSPEPPTGDQFQLWLDEQGFEHWEIPNLSNCFSCFAGWTSCTTAFVVDGHLGVDSAYSCPSGLSPSPDGGYFAAQLTWFNSTGVPGWSDGNELQFYYYLGPIVCESGPPFFDSCSSLGNGPFAFLDSETGKDLANVPGTYHYNYLISHTEFPVGTWHDVTLDLTVNIS